MNSPTIESDGRLATNSIQEENVENNDEGETDEMINGNIGQIIPNLNHHGVGFPIEGVLVRFCFSFNQKQPFKS